MYLRSILLALIFPGLCFFIWYVGSVSNQWSSYLLPAPVEVMNAFVTLWQSGQLFTHIAISLQRVFLGFLAAILTALPLAAFLTLHKLGQHLLRPMLEFFRHVPPLAMLPVLILWLGIGEVSKLAIVFMATFYPIFLNTLTGLQRTDKNLLEVGTQYELSEKKIFFYIRLPYAAPYIFTGLRLGLGYSWRSLIGAEMIAAASGVGYLILDAQALAQPATVIAGIILIGCCGLAMDYVFYRLSFKLYPHYLATRKEARDELY